MTTRHAPSALALAPLLALALSLPPASWAFAIAPGAEADAPPAAQTAEAKAAEAKGAARAKKKAERERKSANLRRVMASMGFGDRALQDAVLRYIATEVKARGPVRRKAQALYATLRDPNTTDDEVRAVLGEYRALLESEHARRRRAEDELNERIEFRTKPRLEAMLTLFGIIGDVPIALPNPRAAR